MRGPLRAALAAWCARGAATLAAPAALRVAAWLVPPACGLLSVLLGQDVSWDLRNYHLYNAFALLHGRLGTDLAAGQWQSYFNPTLDLLYYGLVQALPGPAVAFAMGTLHGLNFVLLAALARAALPHLPAGDRARVPLLLALCGMCSAAFLSELGNSMGDNLTSLFVLYALWLPLRYWDRLARMSVAATAGVWGALPLVMAAGLAMGLGTGLKLTNATYAVGLCVALLTVPGAWWRRVRLAFLFGTGVLAGIAATAGWWFATMWRTFGNPLFPQFNGIFRSPLAQQSGVLDTHHLPHHLGEALVWPLVFTAQFGRISEIMLRPLIWPVVYLLGVALLGRMLWRRTPLPAGRERLLLVFFAVAFAAWTKLFSIHRYLVPIELLAPLVAWVLFHALLAPGQARRAAGWVLLLCAVVVFPFRTWGHAGWGKPTFRADVPAIAQPAQTVVVTAQGDPPAGWMVPFFPGAIRFMALGGGFPETPAWQRRILQALDERRGPHYVLVAPAMHPEQGRLEKRIAQAEMMGLTSSAQGCALLERALRRLRPQVRVAPDVPAPAGKACTLELNPAHVAETAAADAAARARVVAVLGGYGLTVLADACRPFDAWIGDDRMPYMLCELAPRKK